METNFIKIYQKDNDKWEDEDNSYDYGTNVKRSAHIKEGKKFILETVIGKTRHFIAFGVFGVVKTEINDEGNEEFRVFYREITRVEPTPNTLKNRMLQEAGFAGDKAYNMAYILSIQEMTYQLVIEILQQNVWKGGFEENKMKWAPFQLFIASKFNNMSPMTAKKEANTMQYFRQTFPHLTKKDNYTMLQYPTSAWVTEDTVKDAWFPRRWGCIQELSLLNKGECRKECKYSPGSKNSCKDGYGSIWFRLEGNESKLSENYLEVLDEQIIMSKIDFTNFCRYLTNRIGDVPNETKEWVIDTFNFTDEELELIFDMRDRRKNIIHKPTLSKYGKLIYNNLTDKKQVILYGPPGTGKTHLAHEVSSYLIYPNSDSNITFVQFHPSYGYEDFIEGLFPKNKDGKIVYEPRDGHFKRICDLAQQNRNQEFCIIIDEINRANLSKVMGELFYAIEYRGEENSIRLSSSPDNEFYVPENVYIIGTMNTADRSLADIDVALRRRFRFIEISPSEEIIRQYYLDDNEELVELLIKSLTIINERLEERFQTRDLLIGDSYFLLPALNELEIKKMFWYEIIPLLEDYFYQDQRGLIEILGEELFDDRSTKDLIPNVKNFDDVDIVTFLKEFQ